MILIGIALVLAVLLWFFWSYCYDNRIRSTGAVTICCFLSLIMLVSFIVGLTIPVAGYEEPELIETRELIPIKSKDTIEKAEFPTYIILKLRGKENKCQYYIDRNGKEEPKVVSGDVRINYSEVDTPIIESYTRKAKKTMFSLNWGTTEKYYVVTVPQSGIRID